MYAAQGCRLSCFIFWCTGPRKRKTPSPNTPVIRGLQQDPVTNQPQHVLLNLHLIPHPHTGLMLDDKITSSLTQWEIDESKFLMAVTDNGSNMIKAINSIQFNGRQVNPSVGANGANADEAELTDESADNTDDSKLSEGWCKPRHFAERLIFT